VCIIRVGMESDWTIDSRERALELLTRLERPEGLRRDDVLDLGARLLSWTENELSL
jgi:hypothetical protein